MDSSGKGLALVWRRQIQQLNRVSLEIANAIVTAYPSPQILLKVSQLYLHVAPISSLLATFAAFFMNETFQFTIIVEILNYGYFLSM